MITVGVGVGGSGPRALDNVKRALKAIIDDRWMSVRAVSRVLHSPPAGGVTAARFMNAAALFDTRLHPEALLGRLFAIERRLGRVRARRNAARAVDLDVLWTSGQPRASARLVVPHPALGERAFARDPLRECFRRARLPVPPGV